MHGSTDRSEKTRSLVERALRDYESALVHYTSGLLNGDWDRARDVVQDAFLKLCRQDPDAVEAKVKSWLYTVCRNRAYDLLRHANRWSTDSDSLEELAGPTPDPAEDAGRRDAGREVLECVQNLPRNQQDVVRLRFQQGLSYKEIADITGIALGQVGFLLHDAMKRLRAQIEALRKKEASQGGPV
jgi:RNA polymerase sigma-70 factor (ECF subfamily)